MFRLPSSPIAFALLGAAVLSSFATYAETDVPKHAFPPQAAHPHSHQPPQPLVQPVPPLPPLPPQLAPHAQLPPHPHHPDLIPRTIRFPHQGQVRGCDARMPATNMHTPSHSCAQSSHNFLANWQRSFHLRKQCPTGTTMQGVSHITCTDAPTPGFRTGAVYNATVCCETNTAPASLFPQNAPAFPSAKHTFLLPHLEMRFESTAQMQCPELGVAHPRSAISFVPLLRAQAATLDRRCATQGGKTFLSATFHQCGAQPNPRVPRQTQYFGAMDLVCSR